MPPVPGTAVRLLPCLLHAPRFACWHACFTRSYTCVDTKWRAGARIDAHAC